MDLRYLFNACRLSIFSCIEIEKFMMKLNVRLCFNRITFTCILLSVFHETQLFTFSETLFHNWSSLTHKFLQIKSLVGSFVLLCTSIFVFIEIVIVVLRRLIELVFLSILLRLSIFFNIVISG